MPRLRLAIGPELLPGLLAVAVFVVWAATEGGFEPTAWYPGALFLAGLLAATAIAYRAQLKRLPRLTIAAIALLAAFTLWSFLSILWADVQGIAWDGANRTLLYLTIFALFTLPRWRAASAAIVLGAFALGVAGVGAVTLFSAASAVDPTLSFIGGRLAEPTGNNNSTAALFLLAFFPALFLASRRDVPWPAQAVLLAAAGLLAQLAILPQSRGAAIALLVALIVYLAIAPDHGRTVISLAAIAMATALAAPALLDVYSVVQDDRDAAAAIQGARGAALFSFIALLVVGALIALSDRAIQLTSRGSQLVNRVVNAGLVATAAAGAAIALIAIGNPASWVEDRWQDFKGGYAKEGFGSSRFGGSLGSNRYDFWRVSVDEFAAEPLTGMGADNFAVAYVRERRSDEEPLHPHSLPVKVLSQTGLIGFVLFGGFLITGIAGVARVRGRLEASSLARGIAGLALAAFGYWLVHASGDWLWAFPALCAPALAWLGLGAAIERPAGDTAAGTPARPDGPDSRTSGGTTAPPAPRSRAVTIVLWAACGLVAIAATISYTLPWAAARDVERAAATWGANPRVAYDRLDRARRLNPLSDRPGVIAGAIAIRAGDIPRARQAFERALDRNPNNWYARLELGAISALEGRREDAISRLREAQELNPREPLINEAMVGARRQNPVALRTIDRVLRNRLCSRLGRTEATTACR